MHQTTYGETHKIEIFNKSNVASFLEKERSTFDIYQESKNCIYQNKKVISNSSLNYLNEFLSKDIYLPDYQLKSILKKEFDDCEKIYPYLGEIFLHLFFDKEVEFDKNYFVFSKDNQNMFLNTVKEQNAYEIANWIINNSSTDRIVDIDKSVINEIVLKKENDIFLKIDYDTTFLGSKQSLEIKNYRFAIIDGYIESVSEIHHMLHFAAKTKEPYVLFCFGMSDEVKNVIIQNNSKKITQVFPVSMKITEETINILNDIAVIHNSDIISSMKGQTISQEMRKELSIGKSILLGRNGFKLTPLCENEFIKSHIRFLKKRIEDSPPESNTELIRQRIKNLNSKSLKIYVPQDLEKDIQFNRDMEYFFKIIDYSKSSYKKISIDDRNLMIPSSVYKNLIKKVNITKDMFYNIDKIIIRKEK